MKVLQAKTAGFCFGVRRAVEMVTEQSRNGRQPVYTYGPIIHNEQVVRELEQKGVRVLHDLDQLKDMHEGTLIIRSHGVSREEQEKMEASGFAALPILNKRGEYRGTLTEGDLLWALKNMCYMDMRQAEARRIMEITRRKDNVPVRVTTNMHDLVQRASGQNFVPVVDDKETFIGIVTRSAVMKYCYEQLFPQG